MLEGHRLVCDALEAALGPTAQGQLSPPSLIVVSERALGNSVPEGRRLEGLLRQLPDSAVVMASEDVLKVVATTDTPQQVVAVMDRPQLAWPGGEGCEGVGGTGDRSPLYLVCDGVSDPGNMGTLVRSAGATGVDGIVLVGGCADPFNPKALRSAMGATLRLPIVQVKDWEAAVGAGCVLDGVAVHAADMDGVAYYDVDWRAPSALVVGAEAAGLSGEVRGAVSSGAIGAVSIPMAASYGKVESLNAAVAGSVVLCEAFRQKSVGTRVGLGVDIPG